MSVQLMSGASKMAKRLSFDNWYLCADGRILRRHTKSWLTAAVSTLTCEYRVKNHLTKKEYVGHARTPQQACKRANAKIIKEMKEQWPVFTS